MTHLTDDQIEDAFIEIRAKFDNRNNIKGLEVLDSFEERWDYQGELSPKQMDWLNRQLNESWKERKSKAAQTPKVQATPAEKHIFVPESMLNQMVGEVQRISQTLDDLRNQANG